MTTSMRIRALLTAAVLSLGLGVMVAPPASAQWLNTNEATTNVTLRVDDVARISNAGLTVSWKLQFTCPKGVAYETLPTWLIERDNPAAPALMGEDDGIRAVVPSYTGTCTGHRQSLTVVGQVSTTAPYGVLPITGQYNTSAAIVLRGADFFAVYCAAPNCATETGPYVTFK
jgi:hypothetical protein